MTGLTVYTDGACSVGKGGWAWWVHDHLWDSGALAETTNNVMEMTAVIEALKAMRDHYPEQELLIVSDSAYVVNCFHDEWYIKWRENGWVNSSRKPVVNRELWEELIDLFESHPVAVRLRHMRGHGKGGIADAPHVAGNDKADRLAVAARKTVR